MTERKDLPRIILSASSLSDLNHGKSVNITVPADWCLETGDIIDWESQNSVGRAEVLFYSDNQATIKKVS